MRLMKFSGLLRLDYGSRLSLESCLYGKRFGKLCVLVIGNSLWVNNNMHCVHGNYKFLSNPEEFLFQLFLIFFNDCAL